MQGTGIKTITNFSFLSGFPPQPSLSEGLSEKSFPIQERRSSKSFPIRELRSRKSFTIRRESQKKCRTNFLFVYSSIKRIIFRPQELGTVSVISPFGSPWGSTFGPSLQGRKPRLSLVLVVGLYQSTVTWKLCTHYNPH